MVKEKCKESSNNENLEIKSVKNNNPRDFKNV